MAHVVVMYRAMQDPSATEVARLHERLQAFGLDLLDGFGGTFLYNGDLDLALRTVQTFPDANLWTVIPEQTLDPLGS